MKELYIIRHAKSSWSEAGLSDIERPLNDRGLRDGPRMAAYLEQEGFKPQILVSSPAVRAKQTAAYFETQFGVPILIESDLYHGFVSDYIYAVQALDDQYQRAAVFGHNPGLNELVSQIDEDFYENFPTCAIAVISCNCNKWQNVNVETSDLIHLYFPKAVL